MLKKFIVKIMVICMLMTLMAPMTAEAATVKSAGGAGEQISILFSHDMHSHLEKFPKIKSLIREKKKVNPATFVLDAGDFSMGTPYQTIFKQEASELRMMGAVGYDAATFGNHEFDYRSKGIAAMLTAARKSKDKLPQMVIANIDWDKTLEDKKLRSDAMALKSAMEAAGVRDYTVVERSGAKIGVFGIFGMEAASYAPESGTYFRDPIQTSRDMVEKINAHEKVDMIICVSHGGTYADNHDNSEDEILAENVDGIDMIVSGHSHTELSEPIVINGTVIASSGQYNDNLGYVTFSEKEGKYSMDEYKLIPLDKKVKNDSSTEILTEKFKSLVDKKYFSKFGYFWDKKLAENQVEFTGIDTFGLHQGEDPLGSFIADSYKYGVKQAEGSEYETVDIAVAPAGVIRGSFDKGPVTVEDAFNALSLGTGKDGNPGYPLVSVYLTGKELKLAAEIDISVSEIMQPARLYFSGLAYSYNPHRMMLNRAYDIAYVNKEGQREELNDNQLYRVVADLYSAQMLGTVNSMSYGLLSVVPKDKNGKEIEDFEEQIIYQKDGGELKEWYALASYIDNFSGGKVPSKYGQPEGRKVLVDSRNPIALLKNPNRFFWMILAAIALAVSLAALIIVLVVKLVMRIRYGKGAVRRKDMMFGGRYR